MLESDEIAALRAALAEKDAEIARLKGARDGYLADAEELHKQLAAAQAEVEELKHDFRALGGQP